MSGVSSLVNAQHSIRPYGGQCIHRATIRQPAFRGAVSSIQPLADRCREPRDEFRQPFQSLHGGLDGSRPLVRLPPNNFRHHIGGRGEAFQEERIGVERAQAEWDERRVREVTEIEGHDRLNARVPCGGRNMAVVGMVGHLRKSRVRSR